MDDIPSWLSITLLVVFLLMSAFYSSSETAFASINKYKYLARANEGQKKAKLTVWLFEHFDSTLVTVLIGNNVMSILISTFSTFLFYGWLSPYIPDTALSLLTSIVMAILTFLIGDAIPKFLGKARPDAVVSITAYPLAFFVIILFPVGWAFNGLTKFLVKIFGGKEAMELSEEDFKTSIDEAEEEGLLEENESDIIQATFEFDDKSVQDVLTPKSRMTMIDADKLKQDKLHAFLIDCPYSRVPVYYKTKDKVIGILVVKNYLNAYFKDPRVSFISCLQKPYIITPRTKIDDLIEGFRLRRTQIALVKKDKKLLGMVTSEDVMEELVGKIAERPRKNKEVKS